MKKIGKQTKPQLVMGWLDWSLVALLSLLWGGAFFTTAIAVEEVPPFTVVWTRVALAAAVLYLLVKLMRQDMPRSWSVWTMFFIMGAINNLVPFSLLSWGQIHIASGLAAILNATTPLFGVFVAHFFTDDEKITGLKVIGLVFGILGVVVIIGPSVFDAVNGTNLLAQFAVLGAATSYACAGVYGRRFAKMGLPTVVTATGQVTASTLLLLPLILLFDMPWTLEIPSVGTIAALLFLGVFSTALAYVIFFQSFVNVWGYQLNVGDLVDTR